MLDNDDTADASGSGTGREGKGDRRGCELDAWRQPLLGLQRRRRNRVARAKGTADYDLEMDDPNVDDALITAAERVQETVERLRETPIESPELVPGAEAVEQRAEDAHLLAKDAAQAARE